jgi:hypothetical protein
MNLVRIGQVILNLDQVMYIKDAGMGSLMVEFPGGKCLDIAGQADILRTWLTSHVTDATTPIVPSPTTL